MPWATVLRNAAFGLELRGVPRREREDVARAYVEKVGLSGFEDAYPHQLSGGMRQRVGLARALAVDADILLMDEPFASVDEQIRRKFQEDLLRLLSDERKTVIFVTHSIEEAVYVSDQIVILTRGPSRVSNVVRPGVDRSGGSDEHPAQPGLPRLGRADLARAAGLPGDVTWSCAVTGSRWRSRCWCGSSSGRSSAGSSSCRCSRRSPRCSRAFPEVVSSSTFADAAWITLQAFLIGMALSLVVGIGVGILMGTSRAVGSLMGMWVNIFESSPLTAIVPALMALLGFGLPTMIVTVFLFSVWVIALDTQVGVERVNPSLLEMGRSFGASKRVLYSQIVLRAALPELLAGIRLGLIRGLKGVVIGQLLIAVLGRRLPVRAVLAELPDAGVLGAAHHPVRVRLPRVGGGRLLRTKGVVLCVQPLTGRPATPSRRPRSRPSPSRARMRSSRWPGCTASGATTPSTRSRWATTRSASSRSSS